MLDANIIALARALEPLAQQIFRVGVDVRCIEVCAAESVSSIKDFEPLFVALRLVHELDAQIHGPKAYRWNHWPVLAESTSGNLLCHWAWVFFWLLNVAREPHSA